MCAIHTDEGIYGDGEAGLQFAFGALAAAGMLQDFAHLLIGMDPLKNEQIWDKLYRQGYFTQAGGPVVYAAVSALDMAIWDIKGKYFNTSVATLLGGSRREKIRCYASQLQFGWGADKTPATKAEQYAENARKAISEGYSAVKFDFFTFDRDGRSFNEDERTKLLSPYYVHLVEERVAAVREAIGPEKDLIVEGHSFTDAASAIQIGEAIRKYNIFYYEEACTPTPKMQRFVYDALKIPMSSGERISPAGSMHPISRTSPCRCCSRISPTAAASRRPKRSRIWPTSTTSASRATCAALPSPCPLPCSLSRSSPIS